MAKLSLPRFAIGFKTGTNNPKVSPKGKYHLMKHGDSTTGQGMTACGFIIWDDGDRNKYYDIVRITSLSAERLCKKCLGPLKAED
jgi:hypothetical protein